MSRTISYILYLSLLSLVMMGLPGISRAQDPAQDTISYSSTCVGATILFGCPRLASYKPDYMKWHFSDPASGYNDSSGATAPRHVFATPGSYPIELDLYYKGNS